MKSYKFTINGNKYSVDIVDIKDQLATVEVDGTPYQVELEMEVSKPASAHKTVVKVASSPKPQAVQSAVQAAPPIPKVPQAAVAPSGGSVIKSPLPGIILDIFVNVGDKVKQGQHVIMLEAMKMENNIDADREGVIKEIHVKHNDSVMEGDVLVVIG